MADHDPVADKALLYEMREQLRIWVHTNPKLARRCLAEYKKLRIRVARDDINEFMELVVRDRSMRPIVQSPIHEEFHRLADLHDRLILWGHVESGKTLQMAIGRTLWRLGRNPSLQVAIVGAAAQNQSARVSGAIMQYIQRSHELREVFPHLRPGKPWGVTAFNIDRPTYSRDPSVQATSVETGSLQGARIDLMIVDDVVTHDNSQTQENREKLYNKLNSTTFIGRLTEDAQVLWLGNALHPEDAMHRTARNQRWYFARFPVLLPDGSSAWPSQWSLKRIQAKRDECTPDEFARQMLCVARDDSAGRFKRDWINKCLDRGAGKKLAHTLGALPPGYGVYTGVDLGHRKKAGADFTCFFTIVVHPNEDREVVSIDTGRWAGNEIVQRVIDHHDRFNSVVYVENNGAQQYIVDFTKDISAAPVKPLFTGKNKVHPDNGIEGMAVEISNAKWIIPSYGDHRTHPELEQWISEMIYYDPDAHAGDRLMASWIAREGSKQWKKRPKSQQGRMDTVSR